MAVFANVWLQCLMQAYVANGLRLPGIIEEQLDTLTDDQLRSKTCNCQNQLELHSRPKFRRECRMTVMKHQGGSVPRIEVLKPEGLTGSEATESSPEETSLGWASGKPDFPQVSVLVPAQAVFHPCIAPSMAED